jgi:hypothetical protein
MNQRVGLILSSEVLLDPIGLQSKADLPMIMKLEEM